MVIFHYLIYVHPVNQMFFLDRDMGGVIGCASAVTKHEQTQEKRMSVSIHVHQIYIN